MPSLLATIVWKVSCSPARYNVSSRDALALRVESEEVLHSIKLPLSPAISLDCLKVACLIALVECKPLLPLFVKLSLVHNLLNSIARDQAVNLYIVPLTDPICSILGLHVVRGVPIRVEHNNDRCAHKIQSDPARLLQRGVTMKRQHATWHGSIPVTSSCTGRSRSRTWHAEIVVLLTLVERRKRKSDSLELYSSTNFVRARAEVDPSIRT